MKTLSALKREAKNYIWSMTRTNSFFFADGIPDFLRNFRIVTRVQVDRIAFETIKDGKAIESWANFPKAKQVEIVEESNSNGEAYFVKFKQDNGTFVQYYLMLIK